MLFGSGLDPDLKAILPQHFDKLRHWNYLIAVLSLARQVF